MVDPKHLFEILKAQNVDFFTGVPDSLLKDFCAYVDDVVPADKHIIAANEGGAVALAAGYHLATGCLPFVYMQNSGLGNTINPLTSLADQEVYQIPMVLLIGWRGEPGVADEPQHVKMGAVTPALLDATGIPYVILGQNPEEIERQVKDLCEKARNESRPHALLVRQNTFTSYKSQKLSNTSADSLTREEALSIVVENLPNGAAVVSTTGKLSRELFEIREKLNAGHSKDFLTVGSMGHASQIALGVSLAQPHRSIYCFDGDGAAIMHLGSMAIIGNRSPKNLKHILFNNGMHESVGGQKTVGFDVEFCKIALSCGYDKAVIVSDEESLKIALAEMGKEEKLTFLEVRLTPGSRSDLGRPTRSPKENKEDFEKFLRP